MAQSFIHKRAFDDVVVPRNVVVSTGNYACDRPVWKVREEAGNCGGGQGASGFGDNAFHLVEVEHLRADGTLGDGNDLIHKVAAMR